MRKLLSNFSNEEIILVQAIPIELNKEVMSIPMMQTYWNMTSMLPDGDQVTLVKKFVSTIMDDQIELGGMLAEVGVSRNVWLDAPLSKTVFQLMSKSKKDIIMSILHKYILLFDKDPLSMFPDNVARNIWNNKLLR